MKVDLAALWFIRIITLIAITIGILSIIDGILPTRSEPPNPSWPEVLLGLVFLFVGTVGRRKCLNAFELRSTIKRAEQTITDKE